METLSALPTIPVPTYFVSDVHLGATYIPNPTEQLLRLNRLFDNVAQNGQALFLVGDLFDFWYEWRTVIPKKYFGVLYRLRELVLRGIQVHYLAGNHDFRLRGFLEHEIGIRVHHDALSVRIGEDAVYVFHGDGILARDTGYRFLKRVLRNGTAQMLFSWLHPDWGMRLATGTSKTSRTVDRARPHDDEEFLAFAQERFAEGYRGVVMGHTHRPVEHTENNSVYVNLGDWILHYTYAVHDGEKLRLLKG